MTVQVSESGNVDTERINVDRDIKKLQYWTNVVLLYITIMKVRPAKTLNEFIHKLHGRMLKGMALF